MAMSSYYILILNNTSFSSTLETLIDKQQQQNTQMEKSTKSCKHFYKYIYKHFLFIFLISFLLCISILCTHYSTLLIDPSTSTLFLDLAPHENKTPSSDFNVSSYSKSDSCLGRYIYMHNLPSRFNEDIIKNCSSLIKWFNMCKPIANMGLGPQVSKQDGMIQNKSWYLTNQFTLEIIFHNKMKNYKCLTNNSSLASAIFVPFYAGLEIGRHLWDFNTSVRDAASLDLIKWLTSKPEWKYMYGRDHFFIGGRISWDFRRQTDVDSDWGNKLLLLPEAKNMTMLSIESSTIGENELAIPYPSYFHPTSKREILEWQENILSKKRQYLYSFIGAPRPRTLHTIRDEIISLCLSSFETCSFLNCNKASVDCNEPFQVMKMLMNSIFCLQPAGDSYTRRSIFDSILAGCIPVFFHPKSAYEQYLWHFPQDYRKYSVFIPEDMVRNGKAKIDKILVEISENEVLAMRKEISDLIPNVIYGDPRIRLDDFDDAFDIAMKKMIERVDDVRMKMKAKEVDLLF